jgi:preprotein translocase subunit YajC
MGTSTHLLAATTSHSSGFNPTELILILVVVVGFYMLMIRPQRRRQRQAQQKQNSVRPGARVRTTAGMYATVVAVDDETGDVVLEVAPGIEVRYMKRAIMDVVSPGDEPEEPEEPENSYEDEDENESAETEDENESAETEDEHEAEPQDAAEDAEGSDSEAEKADAAAKSGGSKD